MLQQCSVGRASVLGHVRIYTKCPHRAMAGANKVGVVTSGRTGGAGPLVPGRVAAGCVVLCPAGGCEVPVCADLRAAAALLGQRGRAAPVQHGTALALGGLPNTSSMTLPAPTPPSTPPSRLRRASCSSRGKATARTARSTGDNSGKSPAPSPHPHLKPLPTQTATATQTRPPPPAPHPPARKPPGSAAAAAAAATPAASSST